MQIYQIEDEVNMKKDSEILCSNDVITSSLTTKNKTTKNLKKRENMKTKWTTVVLYKQRKGTCPLLFYCTVHSIMWTIRNSKALGKKERKKEKNNSSLYII